MAASARRDSSHLAGLPARQNSRGGHGRLGSGSQPAKGVASSIIRPLLLIGATAVMPQPDAHFACGVSIGGLGISSGTDAADRRSDT